MYVVAISSWIVGPSLLGWPWTASSASSSLGTTSRGGKSTWYGANYSIVISRDISIKWRDSQKERTEISPTLPKGERIWNRLPSLLSYSCSSYLPIFILSSICSLRSRRGEKGWTLNFRRSQAGKCQGLGPKYPNLATGRRCQLPFLGEGQIETNNGLEYKFAFFFSSLLLFVSFYYVFLAKKRNKRKQTD